MPTIEHNRSAWNQLSSPACPWSRPVTAEQLQEASDGPLRITLAGPREVPQHWLGNVQGRRVLCLAAAGGQQAPLLAAAGAEVTLLDLSDEQLAVDKQVCEDSSLMMEIVQGSMTDLSCFPPGSFDLIVNPVSSCYIPDVQPLWQACHRVLAPGGKLLSGAISPVNFLFEENEGALEGTRGLLVKHALPYVESDTLDGKELAAAIDRNMVFTFGHTLESLIQGQLDAGFVLTGMLESRRTDDRAPVINQYIATYLATCAQKGEV